ncbi:hypothetical protein HMI55_007197 [Coelomomyces lativittatus]|nr:hypothetical protein HMI55_007197 [Coelomomyces lativittatus]
MDPEEEKTLPSSSRLVVVKPSPSLGEACPGVMSAGGGLGTSTGVGVGFLGTTGGGGTHEQLQGQQHC